MSHDGGPQQFFSPGPTAAVSDPGCREKHYAWGGLTTTFILAPWTINFVGSFYYWWKFRNNVKTELIYLLASTLNLRQVAILARAVWLKWRVKDFRAKRSKSYAKYEMLLQVILEAYPQFGLQLYIASRSNSLDAALIFSIASSSTRGQTRPRLTLLLVLNLAVSDTLSLGSLPVVLYALVQGWTLGAGSCSLISYLLNCCLYAR